MESGRERNEGVSESLSLVCVRHCFMVNEIREIGGQENFKTKFREFYFFKASPKVVSKTSILSDFRIVV